MMMKYSVIFLLLIGFTGFAFAESPETPVITQSYEESIAAFGEKLYMAYSYYDGVQSDIYFKISNDGGKSFSESINISNTSGRSFDPLISITNEFVYIVWSDETNLHLAPTNVWFSKSSDYGKTFSNPIVISKENNYSSATVNHAWDIASFGKNVYIAYLVGNFDWIPVFVAVSNDGGNTFSIKNISNSESGNNRPKIETFANNVYVAWFEHDHDHSTSPRIQFTKSNDYGQSFDTPQNISQNKHDSREVALAANENTVYVIWRDDLDEFGSNLAFVKSVDGGNTLSAKTYVGFLGARPDIVTQDDSIYITTWTQTHNGTDWIDAIGFIHSPDGGNSFDEKIIAEYEHKVSPYFDRPHPKIAAVNDNVYVVWRYVTPEKINTPYIASSSNAGADFEIVDLDANNSKHPNVVASGKHAYITFTDKYDDGSRIKLVASTHEFNGTLMEIPDCPEGTIFSDGVCSVTDMNVPPFNTDDCLIATASYGSELAPQVQMLREVRDNILFSTYSGTLFMEEFNKIYYSFSPQIAHLENENPAFKEMVKLFITPMISALSIMTLANENSEYQVILFGTSTIGLIVGMYVVAPLMLVWRIKGKSTNIV